MVMKVDSTEEFRELIAKDQITVIDFFATWCGPCKMISPLLEKLAEEFGSATFAKADVEELPGVAAELEIHSMPTISVFRAGRKLSQVIGAKPDDIRAAVASAVAA